jgi:hypothetical protein
MTTVVSTTRFYQYVPLRFKDEMRLVQITPGSSSERTIHCEIIHCRRSSSRPRYEALSYAWGHGLCPESITVGPTSSCFLITSNCYNALRRLRHRKKTRVIWIDALCIDQANNEEKTEQVRLMGNIYTEAHRVIVYLGEANKASRLVFRYAKKYLEGLSDILPRAGHRQDT